MQNVCFSSFFIFCLKKRCFVLKQYVRNREIVEDHFSFRLLYFFSAFYFPAFLVVFRCDMVVIFPPLHSNFPTPYGHPTNRDGGPGGEMCSPFTPPSVTTSSSNSVGQEPVFLFRHRIQPGGLYAPQAKRYVLYVSDACPFSSRCLAYLSLKHLTQVVTVGMVSPVLQECAYHRALHDVPVLPCSPSTDRKENDRLASGIGEDSVHFSSSFMKGATTSVHLQHHYSLRQPSPVSLLYRKNATAATQENPHWTLQECLPSKERGAAGWGGRSACSATHTAVCSPLPRNAIASSTSQGTCRQAAEMASASSGCVQIAASTSSSSVSRIGKKAPPDHCSCGWAFHPSAGYKDPLDCFETVADIYRLSLFNVGELRFHEHENVCAPSFHSSSCCSSFPTIAPHCASSGGMPKHASPPIPTRFSLTHTSCSLPLLFDTETRTIVNNSCSDICEMLNESFQRVGNTSEMNLIPRAGLIAIREVNKRIIRPIITSIRECDKASSRQQQEQACSTLLSRFEEVERILSHQLYLCAFPCPDVEGGVMHCLTDCDIRFATILVRFDDIYAVCCGCHQKRIGRDFPHILEWLRDLVQTNHLLPFIANLTNAKAYYVLSPRNLLGHLGNIRDLSEEGNFENCLLVPSCRHTLVSSGSYNNQAPVLQRKKSAHYTDGICAVSPSTSSMICKEKLDSDNMEAKTKKKSISASSRREPDVHSESEAAQKKMIPRKKSACRRRKKRTTRSRTSIRLRSSSRSRPGKRPGKIDKARKKKSKGKRLSHRKKIVH